LAAEGLCELLGDVLTLDGVQAQPEPVKALYHKSEKSVIRNALF